MIKTGTLLPLGFYTFPSMIRDLAVLALGGKVFSRLGTTLYLHPSDFYIPVRRIFLIVSSLGGIWVYFTLRRWSGVLAAGFGAGVYLLSWELAYHARWIAPDAGSFSASMTGLTLAALTLAWHTQSSRWFYLPAIAAGAAFGPNTKARFCLCRSLFFFSRLHGETIGERPCCSAKQPSR